MTGPPPRAIAESVENEGIPVVSSTGFTIAGTSRSAAGARWPPPDDTMFGEYAVEQRNPGNRRFRPFVIAPTAVLIP